MNFRKGIDLFIDLAKILANLSDNYVFIIIGDYEDKTWEEFASRRLEQYKLKHKFYQTGFRPNVFPFLELINHLAFTSRCELFLRSILESIVMQKTVSCFKISGNHDVVGKDYGLLCDC